jgi:hypothetical protein
LAFALAFTEGVAWTFGAGTDLAFALAFTEGVAWTFGAGTDLDLATLEAGLFKGVPTSG